MKIDDLLRFMVQQEASDLHVKPMRPPLLRVKGKLLPLKSEPLKPDLVREMLMDILSERNQATLENEMAVDFGHSLAGVSRFRALAFHQRGTVSAVFRRVPFDFPSLDDWGLPEVLKESVALPQGLVLITGPTGSGKSSTLAAIMRLISDSRLCHIVTIEDPIEFLLKDGVGAVTQREVGTDTPSFSAALRNSLRQDPDVIMVGEMRDRTTMETVLQAAETGHLVFSTLHTNSATQTIDRIIDQFPSAQQRQIRQQLASVLQFVVSLRLVERADGAGMTAAVEILRHTPRVQKLIQEGNLDALQEEIENSVTYHRMQSMNQSLAALVLHQAVSRDTALEVSTNPGDLDLMLRKMTYAQEYGEEGNDMSEPLCDFSKILELQEIKKAYDELEERTRRELVERDEEIERLRQQVDAIGTTHDNGATGSAETERLQSENERLSGQIQLIRNEYESKIERLNGRIKELSGGTPAATTAASKAVDEPRRGFFRR
jgi:twitching motility protein PilT